MESFYRTHDYLLTHLNTPIVRRVLTDEINWNERLIGIKGSRGVGKTTFLLAYAKEFYGIGNRKCLFINLNHFFFTDRTLFDFAKEFYLQGGKTLLIDQVFKYPEWSRELRKCYDLLPDLKIVFTGSAVMRLKEENPDLAGKVAVYYLRGFSFREYLNLTNNMDFKIYSLNEIIDNQKNIAREITKELGNKLLRDFKDYLHHGFYPFYLEKRNYSENLLKTINMTLEVDVLYIRQIEQRYLPKIRKLLYLLSLEAPCAPNVSQLSKELEISRATVMNYFKYLKDARLVNMLYNKGVDFPKKPALVYVYNTNLQNAINLKPLDKSAEYKTFFYNQIQKDMPVYKGKKKADFLIDNNLRFCIKENSSFKNDSNMYYAVNEQETVDKNVIPLWLFGFLY
jgi:predicted AAA+ superfamily ATPase